MKFCHTKECLKQFFYGLCFDPQKSSVVGHPIRYAVMVVRLRQWDGAAGLAKELLALAAFAQHDARECFQLAEAGNAHAAQALAQIGVLGARVLTLERELIEGMEIMKVSVKYGLGDPCACGVQSRTLTSTSLICLRCLIRRLRQRP